MATLCISGLCLLSFLTILVAYCCVCCGRRHTSKYLPWSVWLAVFSMIGFFSMDIANRVLHELKIIVPAIYIAIDIPMGSMSYFADLVLMIYLYTDSPVDVKSKPYGTRLAMKSAIVMYFIISLFTKGSQIWNLMGQINSDTGKSWYHLKSLDYYQGLGTAAFGLLLAFSIGFGLLSIGFIRLLPPTYTLRARLSWAIGIFATVFLARNIVMFTFTIIYSQLHYTASLGAQLIYMAFYGLLSVVLYVCVVWIAAVRRKEDDMADGTRYGRVQQMAVNEGIGWQPEKPQVQVSRGSFQPYQYESGSP